MRETKRQAMAQAETLAMQALERARMALHHAPSGPERHPNPASQFAALHPYQRFATPAWARQQPEITTIALTLCVCVIGLLRG